MSVLEEHFAAVAARMVDAEVMWMAQRLPSTDEQSVFHKAVKAEAERRFPTMTSIIMDPVKPSQIADGGLHKHWPPGRSR